MRHIVQRLVLGALLVTFAPRTADAQQSTVRETLSYINNLLEQHSYRDHDDQLTVSHVTLRRGSTLVVEVAKTKGDTKTSTIYEVDIDGVDLEGISARQRGNHTVLVIESTVAVATKLKSVSGGTLSHEWDLPSRDDLSLEFRSDPAVEQDLTAALVRLITLARGASSSTTA
ncbi:MAG: hypothetical protein GTN62_07595 [Gemmatimonadales bacterium]|nr:hypothetical protein [Gemmatimonadales bacterium]NIN11354.1 hypothetical protein [Gemmatimonadales bacterium]NIN49964.1 hypothetical protein [Gemmatimonadales bacterium]NIP07428.1 hypothetical protein [Gemmatimonadales bacterium]NIR00495.1 hypothetical protein [Gemmatimonadales bacterium]